MSFETEVKAAAYMPNESHYNATDVLLENEKKANQCENWNKLDKTTKLSILTAYADIYGKKRDLSNSDILALKRFFRDANEKGKFQKAKDVVYNKTTREIEDIPALTWNATTNNFTLRNLDTKKVSLLKSLTPKRLTPKNTSQPKLSIHAEPDVSSSESTKQDSDQDSDPDENASLA